MIIGADDEAMRMRKNKTKFKKMKSLTCTCSMPFQNSIFILPFNRIFGNFLNAWI